MLYDPDSGSVIRTLYDGEYSMIRFSGDGSKMALVPTRIAPHLIYIHDLSTGALLRTIEVSLPGTNYELEGLVLSHDGWTVAANYRTTSSPLITRTLAWNTGSEALLMDQSPSVGKFLGWPQSGLLIEPERGMISILSNETFEVMHELESGICELININFSPDGETLYCTGTNDTADGCDMNEFYYQSLLTIVDIESGVVTHELKALSGTATDFVLYGNDSKLTLVEEDSVLSTWSTEGYSLANWRYKFGDEDDYSFRIAMTRDGQSVACWRNDAYYTSIWSGEGTFLGRVSPRISNVLLYPSFSPNGEWLLARENGTTTIWNASTQQVAGTLPEYASAFTGRDPKEVLRITANQILVGPFDGEATVSRSVAFPNDEEIWQLGMSRNGEYFWGIPWLTGSLLVGEVATGNYTWMTFPNFRSYISAPAVSDDGRRVTLRSTTLDGANVNGIFDVASGQQFREIPVVSRAYFSADGDWIFANTSSVQQWAATVNGCKIQCGEAEGDKDDDGLSDCVESCYQTDPEIPDTDGDYIPDGYEADHGYEPLLADAGPDDDGDGLGLHAEEYYGTSPGEADSDEDGATDLEEIVAGTDPLVNESNPEGLVEGSLEGEVALNEGEVEGGAEGNGDEGEEEGNIEGNTEGEGIVDGEPEEGAMDGEVETPVISAEEVLEAFHTADGNRDSRLDASEFAASSIGSPSDFDLLDTNDNGFLSISELQRQISGSSPVHDADLNGDHTIGLTEVLRVVQLRNGGGYDCAPDPDETEDGYLIDADASLSIECPTHASDFEDSNGQFSLGELLRLIQLYNSAAITACDTSEDGFCVSS